MAADNSADSTPNGAAITADPALNRIGKNSKIKRFRNQLARITNFWSITNILFSTLFFILRILPPMCEYLFRNCQMDMSESQAVLFMFCIAVVKNRRALDWVSYLKTFLLLCKVLNLYLFWTHDMVYGLAYAVCWLIFFVVFPEPDYSGTDNVSYFTQKQFEAEIDAGKSARCKRVLVICFYTPFAQTCINFAPLIRVLRRFAEYEIR